MRNIPLAPTTVADLLGAALHDLPPHSIKKLDEMLHALHADQSRQARAARAWLSGGASEPHRDVPTVVADRWASSRLQGLAAVLELLHAAHLDRLSQPTDALLADHLVEGLLIAGRCLTEGRPIESPSSP